MTRTTLRRATAGAVALLITTLSACGGRDDSAGEAGISDDSIKIGASFPLSGPVSAFGEAQACGLRAVLEATNADGGVEMSDGGSRTIDLTYYDDAFDPAKIVQNFRKLVDQDGVFAFVGAFGTASNAAVMPLANEEAVPQVFLASGASVFSSDQEANPWTLGWLPTYEQEAAAFGEYLVGKGVPLKVAFIGQNDDLGKAYKAGLEEALEGSQVSIVKAVTYEVTDTSVDSQISDLQSSGADVLFSAVAVPRLQAAALKRMAQLGWSPETYLTAVASGVESVIVPSGAADALPELYTTGFYKRPENPAWAEDETVTTYKEDLAKTCPDVDPSIPNAIWGYASGDTLVRTLEGMEDLSREGFMDSIHRLSNEDVAMLLPDVTVDGTDLTKPPVSTTLVQRFSNGQWQLIDEG